MYNLQINARRLFLLTLSFIAVLLLMDMFARWTFSSHPGAFTFNFKHAFDLDEEYNVPSTFSALQLGFASFILARLAAISRQAGKGNARNWVFLSVIFAYLALDEFFVIHEYAGELIKGRIQTSGAFAYAWVIPAIAFITVVGILNIPFLLRLPGKYRIGFMVAGAAFVLSAVGGDMLVGAVRAYSPGLEKHHFQLFENLVEEGGEMVSIAWFINQLVKYRQEHLPSTGRRWSFMPFHAWYRGHLFSLVESGNKTSRMPAGKED